MNNNNGNDPNDNKDYIDLRKEDAPGQTPPERIPVIPAPVYEKPPRRKLRAWHIVLIVLASLLVLGFPATFILNSFNIYGNMSSGTPIYDESFAAARVQNIDVTAATISINVQHHNGSDVRVVYTPPRGRNYVRPVYELNDATNTLRIGILDGSYRFRLFSFHVGRPTITIYLPHGMELNSASFTTSTGRVTADGVSASGDIEMRSTTGRVEARNLSAQGNIGLRATTGRIEAHNIIAGGSVNMRTTTGRIEGSNISSYASIEATATTGRVEVSNVSAQNRAEIRTTTGRIDIVDLDAASLTANSTTGRIELENINITWDASARATTGRIYANRITVGGSLNVTTTTGRIEVSNATVTGNGDFSSTTGRNVISNSRIDGRLNVRATTGNITLTNVSTDMNNANINNNRNSRVTIN